MSYREIDVTELISFGLIAIMFTITIVRYRKKVRKVNFRFLIS